jgi:hypothetical protein
MVVSVLVLITAAAVAFAVSSLTNVVATPNAGVSAAELRAQAAARKLAAAWVTAEVSNTTVVSCDPVMCRALQADGFPGGQLLVMGPAAPYPLSAAVVIATPAIRSQFGSSLATAYAPAVLASFGSGDSRVDIRVVSSQGAAAYRAELSADLLARKAAAVPLLGSKQIAVFGTAARQLASGQVDSRLLVTIAGIASLHPVTIVDFGGTAPGASPGIPLSYVDLAKTASAAPTRGSLYVQSVIAQLSALQTPFRPARVELVRLADGQTVLRIEFAEPSPLGLLSPSTTGSP